MTTTQRNASTTPATDLINELARMQAIVNLTLCRCCGKRLDVYTQALHPKSTRQPSQYATCRTVGCERINITREINELYALSQDVIDSFHAKAG